MRKFNIAIQSGTKVMHNDKWYVVKCVDQSRKWVQLHDLVGSFQVGHITRFTNV